jgi:serine/threonine-protein kinase
MGIVYRATDPVIGRTVAVKTIRLSEEGTGMSREELIARFQTEARAAGLLTHPNIVVIYDAGEEEGLFYITMELIEGRSLQAQIDSKQTFPLPRVLRLMEQACSALQFAHERNVVHRDIKPANLMLTADDTLKITDFGTAKILQFGTTHQTAQVVGTPSYMSPEQVKGKAVDGRSDIFSLGVVLYEVITGEKPFPGQNITTVIYKIVNEDPIPPRQLDSSIHPGLDYVITKALAKQPDARYQTCREMLEELRNYRELRLNPNATMALSSGAQTQTMTSGITATVAMRPPAVMTQGSAGSTRTSYVKQTPEPAKNSGSASAISLSIILLAVIGYAGYRLRPTVQDLLQRTRANQADAAHDKVSRPDSSPALAPPPDTPTPESGATPAPTTEAEKASEKPTPPAHRPESASVNPEIGSIRVRIEKDLQSAGLSGKIRLHGVGNTLTLSGRLNPGEHRRLLQNLKNIPTDVHLVDHIEYAADSSNAGETKSDDRPRPTGGLGALEVTSDVIGATAILRGPAGRIFSQCQTPCRFDDLNPQRYILGVGKAGYKPVQTPLVIAAGEILDQRIQLEATAEGLFVSSHPSGADIFLDGAKQSGPTPATLVLGPGQYNLVVKKPGFDPYAGQVQVKTGVLTTLDVELAPSSTRVAWANVRTAPLGAEILVDGNSTGQVTPARVQLTAGEHTVTLRLKGFVPANRRIFVDEGQSVQVNEALHWQE